MLILGYIISETKYRDLSEDIFQIVKNEEDCTMNLPKMIIGLSQAKEYAQKHNFEFDILNNMFPNGNMWTFKKTEKREYYIRDIEIFKNYIKKNISNDINYYYINIYKLKYNDIKRLYNILFNNSLNKDINYILIDNNMLYFPLLNQRVIGISFSHLEYIGIKKDKIIGKLRNNIKNKIYYSTSKNMWKLKDWFNGQEYIIPSILTNNWQIQKD